MHELIFISNVFQEYQIFGVKGDVPTMFALVKEVLCDEDYRNIAVMTTFREQVTHLD
jgi:hypothetical protein